MTSKCLNRSLSSKVSILKDELRHRLKDLYKKVHPDLFHDDPLAKGVNERNFKLLQEYLAAAEKRAGSGGSASVPYKFTFHVKSHNVEDGRHSFTANLTLPPPNRALPRATHEALNRLLAACGIACVEDIEVASHNSQLRLRDFIPGAAEAFHNASSQHGGPRYELAAVRTALQLNRRISLVIAQPLANAGSLQQLAAARQLLQVVEADSCPTLVEGLTIGLGDGFRTDASGTVWLRSDATAVAWDEFLRQKADLAGCHEHKRRAAAIREREHAVSRALGVGMLSAHPRVATTSEYAAFLERAVAASTGSPQLMRKVSIYVEGTTAEGTIACRVDDHGKVCVPVDVAIGDLVAALRKLGPRAAQHVEMALKQESEVQALTRQVERTLKLRLLARDPNLPTHKFRAGCLRLLSHSEVVGPLLGGLCIRLSEVNSFVPGRSYIDVSWSFTP